MNLTYAANKQLADIYDVKIIKGEVTITKYRGKETMLVIPETLYGLPVIGIGDYAFSYCQSLINVTVPCGIEIIGEEAFSYCCSLKHLIIRDGVTHIMADAFRNCDSLIDIEFHDGLNYIEEGAFAECLSLRDVNIPEGVKVIEDFAFYGCSALKTAAIPNSVKKIGGSAFNHCSSLMNVTIPDRFIVVEDDGEWEKPDIFYGCPNLKEVNGLPYTPKPIEVIELMWNYDEQEEDKTE